MSIELMNDVRPLKMPPTAKAVLVWMANCANSDGVCWPTIERLQEWTCYGRTAIIDAIKWLELEGYLVGNRTNGRKTVYTIKPVRQTDQSASRTGTPAGPNQSAYRTGPVRQADSNNQEQSRTEKREEGASASTPSTSCPDGVSEHHWAMWIAQLQSDGKESISRLMAAKLQILRIVRDGGDAEAVIEAAILRGWRDLQDIHAEMKAKTKSRDRPVAQARQITSSAPTRTETAFDNIDKAIAHGQHPQYDAARMGYEGDWSRDQGAVLPFPAAAAQR